MYIIYNTLFILKLKLCDQVNSKIVNILNDAFLQNYKYIIRVCS